MSSLPIKAPTPPRQDFRFELPPSVGESAARERAKQLEGFLSHEMARPVQVTVAPSYDVLAKGLLSGRVDAAWAPPFVCARIEAMGVRVLVRGVRRGASSYRAAILARADASRGLESLEGVTAAWSDRDSVGGYLLPIAFFRSKGLDPAKMFSSQRFLGSYRAALEELAAGRADVSSIFAPPAQAGLPETTGLDEVAPDLKGALSVVAFTEESPNDGVAVSMTLSPLVTGELERVLLAMPSTPDGARLVQEIFRAECFEPAPRMGYRALYRVALASL